MQPCFCCRHAVALCGPGLVPIGLEKMDAGGWMRGPCIEPGGTYLYWLHAGSDHVTLCGHDVPKQYPEQGELHLLDKYMALPS